jgi:hypothetical protein
MYIRATDSSVKIGRMNLELTYTRANSPANAKNIWFTKKNGSSCGIVIIYVMSIILYLYLI